MILSFFFSSNIFSIYELVNEVAHHLFVIRLFSIFSTDEIDYTVR